MNTLRNHFIKSSTGGKPNYTISYTADQQVPFIGGEETSKLTMWETGYESEPLAAFEVVGDAFADGYGEWGIKTSNPSCFYGLIKDKNGYEYSMDSDNSHTITGLIFPSYDYNGNNITSIGGPLLGGGEGNSLTDVTLPYYLEYIGDSTFKGSTLLQTITIPEYVESLGNYAFLNCNSLTSIAIPYNVESIGKDCFKGCVNLTKFYCFSLTPPSLNGSDIFGNVSTLPNLKIYVYFVEDYLLNEDWSKYANIIYLDPCVISYKATAKPSFNSNNVTPSSYTNHFHNNGRGFIRFSNEVIQINGQLFLNNIDRISNIYLPNTITTIGERAFYECSSLTSITIPDSVTSIGKESFLWCSSLTEVTLSNNLEKIHERAFNYCYRLSLITIPKNITYVSGTAFGNCRSLTSVVWNAITYSDLSSSLFDLVKNYLTNISIGNEVVHIPQAFCMRCSKIESVVIPKSVTSIGNYPFGGCSSLTSIVVEDNNTVYDSRENCNAIIETASNVLITGCKNTIIPSSVTSIGDYAFLEHPLETITIPNSVVSIGSYAFNGCTKLSSIVYTGTLEQWRQVSLGKNWDGPYTIVVHCIDGDITLS